MRFLFVSFEHQPALTLLSLYVQVSCAVLISAQKHLPVLHAKRPSSSQGGRLWAESPDLLAVELARGWPSPAHDAAPGRGVAAAGRRLQRAFVVLADERRRHGHLRGARAAHRLRLQSEGARSAVTRGCFTIYPCCTCRRSSGDILRL